MEQHCIDWNYFINFKNLQYKLERDKAMAFLALLALYHKTPLSHQKVT
jgi:hypothetical protein